MLSPIRFFRNRRYVSLFRLMSFSQAPIMICGCGRSGTTLLLSILSAHPAIHAIDFETKIFTKRPYGLRSLNHWHHLAKIYLILIGRPVKKTANRWMEKNPRNIEYLPQILDEFGASLKVINIVRDGRDVITSMHPETSGKGFHVEPERWIKSAEMGLKFKAHKQVFTVRYEDLLEQFEPTMKKLLAFLELDYVDLSSFQNASQVTKHRAWSGEVKPLHNASIRKWEKDEFKERIETFMNADRVPELLNSYGYE